MPFDSAQARQHIMNVRPRGELEKKASFIFQDLERNYRPCEALYILSELTKTMSLVMLQREQAES